MNEILYCPEYDEAGATCLVNNKSTPCKGELNRCPFFDIYTLNEKCVLTKPRQSESEKQIVESLFYLGEGYEKRGLLRQAIESYERALKAEPEKNQIKDIIERLRKLEGS